jgi:UDP-glucose 4-epimerase
MKVFVTGGAGFIGSHLCKLLLSQGHQVTAYDNLMLGRKELLKDCIEREGFKFIEADLLDMPVLEKEMRGHDLVFHLAANSDISKGAEFTDIDLKNGTLATYSTLEAMRKLGIKELIFASTSAIYGEASVKPTPENYGPLFPISYYGASKLACEALCTAFAHNCGMKIWAYRFANIVGSQSTHGVIIDFLRKLKKTPTQLEVLGNGTQRKSYLHVEDCIAGMLHGYKNSKNEFQLYNLASHGVTEVKFIAEEVVRQFTEKTGNKPSIKYGEGDRGWRGDVPYTYLDGSMLEKLGWKPSLDSNTAVRKAVGEIIIQELK